MFMLNAAADKSFELLNAYVKPISGQPLVVPVEIGIDPNEVSMI
jgi:hypothetical protein